MHKTDYLRSELTEIRHDFHAHPELGFEETRTAARVAELLRGFGLEVHEQVGKTGVVGILQRGNATRSIGLRADMDALPITELNTFPYSSKDTSAMHACGHDGHTTMLLGAAKYLSEKGDFDGRVVFIFQPNEEHGLGAPAMIEDNLFARFDVDDVYAMHNMPGMRVGTFATSAGPFTASESLFEITINARGGHAALPHMGVDAIVVGAQIVNALQTIVSRKIDPSINGVVSITDFRTDGKRNVLPGKAVLTGDARALTPEINSVIEKNMRALVDGICAANGVTATVVYDTIFPALINSAKEAESATKAAAQMVGADNVDGNAAAKLFSEDFAHMAIAKPACYILAGNGTSGSNARPLHSADYDFNDELLTLGSTYWATLVEQELNPS